MTIGWDRPVAMPMMRRGGGGPMLQMAPVAFMMADSAGPALAPAEFKKVDRVRKFFPDYGNQ